MRPLLFLALAAGCAACGFPPGITITPTPVAKVTCAKGTGSCRCQNASFSLIRDETPTASCDTSLGTNASCCYDLNSSGETTSCDCREYVCFEANGTCSCGIGAVPSGATKVNGCSEKPGSRNCCWGTGYSCTCQNYSGTPFGCAGGTGLVSKCPDAKEYFSSCGAKTAASCQGLTWKP